MAVVFTVEGDAVTTSHIHPELRAMTPTTYDFGMNLCKGVALTDLLTGLGITDTSLWVQIDIEDADTYYIPQFSVPMSWIPITGTCLLTISTEKLLSSGKTT